MIHWDVEYVVGATKAPRALGRRRVIIKFLTTKEDEGQEDETIMCIISFRSFWCNLDHDGTSSNLGSFNMWTASSSGGGQ